MGFLSSEQISEMGFAAVGENVLLSDKASFYNCKNIYIGNNVRIDDFCVLSAGVNGIEIGNFIHIAIQCSLIGAEKIKLEDFCNLSSRVSIYSSSDDYTGEFMTNPMVAQEFTNVDSRSVLIGKHVIVGSGSIILPGVRLGDGCAVGALSLVKESFELLSVAAGNPAKKIKKRKDNIFNLEKQFMSEFNC